MNSILTEYDKSMFSKLTSLHYRVYYRIDPNRTDKAEFVAMLKKRIDLYNDFEFIRGMTYFRRIYTVDNWEAENKAYNKQLMDEYIAAHLAKIEEDNEFELKQYRQSFYKK